MSYASDLGLKVGSKIKALEDSDFFSINEVLTMVKDDGIMPDFRSEESGEVNPFCITRNWEHYKEEEKDMTSTTKIKFPCCVPTSEIKDAKTLLALIALFEANGATVYDGVDCGGGHEFDRVDSWDYFGVSLRADRNTFGKDFYRTDFYDDFEDYNQSEVSSELTIYHVANLLGDNPSVASQEAITERLEDNPSVGIDYSVMGTIASTEPTYKVGDPVVVTDLESFNVSFVKIGDTTTVIDILPDGSLWLNCSSWPYKQICNPDRVKPIGVAQREVKEPPLIAITQEVKYTVVIKGTTFTFTQDELDALTEELLGFTTL